MKHLDKRCDCVNYETHKRAWKYLCDRQDNRGVHIVHKTGGCQRHEGTKNKDNRGDLDYKGAIILH